jgi:putative restriction endonuclease
MLNAVDEIAEQEIETAIANHERREVLANIKRKFREHDFRRRVLSAYGSACAFCGLQLKLVEAAHILPVAALSSTDETINGVALCALHHRAFDQNLLSFDESYRIEISAEAVADLTRLNLAGGLAIFQRNLKSAILLPADRRDYPAKQYINESRKLRQWRA